MRASAIGRRHHNLPRLQSTAIIAAVTTSAASAATAAFVGGFGCGNVDISRARCFPSSSLPPPRVPKRDPLALRASKDDDGSEWTSDFDGFYEDFPEEIGGGGSDDGAGINSVSMSDLNSLLDQKQRESEAPPEPAGGEIKKEEVEEKNENSLQSNDDVELDLSGASYRQFSLGPDIIISDYAGSMGFDAVTDWEYFAIDDSSGERTRVNPRPFDDTQPKRTRDKSGAVVRLFRGELGGRLGASIRSVGGDRRVLIREYSGDDALLLARAERFGLGRVQSALVRKRAEKSNEFGAEAVLEGEWVNSAQNRYFNQRTDTATTEDDKHVMALLDALRTERAPFVALLGEMNLDDYYDDPTLDPNEWYKSLGVKPPKPGSVWLVYEYAGLTTAGRYAEPAPLRLSKLPPRRGPFGGLIPPSPPPPWNERARYVVRGVLKGMLEAVATTHESGMVHRSVGRNSFVLSGTGQDKAEATSPYAILPERLNVKLSDWGFACKLEDVARDGDFRARARVFQVDVSPYEKDGAGSLTPTTSFAMAEDMHALGFVILGMLLTTLADIVTPSAQMPPTDEDSLQRLLGEIFEKDMGAFREYCADEEYWTKVVEILDGSDSDQSEIDSDGTAKLGDGWELLEALMFARERVAENVKNGTPPVTARMLLDSPFFKQRFR